MSATQLSKRLAALLLAAALLAQGCAQQRVVLTKRPAPLPEQVRAELGTVGVLPGRVTARSNYQEHEATRSSGSGGQASDGAMAGAAVGSTGALALLPFAIVFPPMLIVAGGVFLVSTAGGAAVGASQEVPSSDHAESMKVAERAIGDALGLKSAQADLHLRVMKAARGLSSVDLISLSRGEPAPDREAIDLQVYAEGGFDTLLLANVDEVTVTAEEGLNPILAIDVVVRSILLSASRGAPIDERIFTCRAGKRSARAWRVPDERLFREAVSRCYEKIADRIIEEVFLVYVPPEEEMSKFGGNADARVDLQTGRHTFAWDPLPLPNGRGEVTEEGRFGPQDVTYDLRIWRAEDRFPGELVYERTALPGPRHTAEIRLEASSHYFWTVRARFRLEGRTRVTPWAVKRERHGYSPDRLDRVTNDFYYRFTTPPVPDTSVPAVD